MKHVIKMVIQPSKRLIFSLFFILLFTTPTVTNLYADNQNEADWANMELLLFSGETLMSTATKRQQKLSDVPGTVILISEDDIRQLGITTLEDLLPLIPGATIAESSNFLPLRFRGIEMAQNNKILFLVNGRKLNQVDSGSFSNYYGALIRIAKQIEIIKGPGSSLYGANAFAGVINVITKKGDDVDGAESNISLGYNQATSSWSRYYDLAIGQKIDDHDILATAGYWREFVADPADSDNQYHYRGNEINLSYHYKDLVELHLGYWKSVLPSFSSEVLRAKPDLDKLERFYISSTMHIEINRLSKLHVTVQDAQQPYLIERRDYGGDVLSFEEEPPEVDPTIVIDKDGNIIAIDDAEVDDYMEFEDFEDLIGPQDLIFKVSRAALLNRFEYEVQYDLAWPVNNFIVTGVNFTYDMFDSEVYYPQISDYNLAAYFQDEYQILNNLSLLAGLRYDYNTGYGSKISPRVSTNYTATDKLRLKALYGQAYRAPNYTEQYIDSEIGLMDLFGNLEIKPETVEQSELEVNYQLLTDLNLKGLYFYWQTKDEIQVDVEYGEIYAFLEDLSEYDDSFPAVAGFLFDDEFNPTARVVSWKNIVGRSTHGYELELRAKPWNFMSIRGNYSRFYQYSPTFIASQDWAPGNVDVANIIINFRYYNLFFANVIARMTHEPRNTILGLNEDQEENIRNYFFQTVDVVFGARYKGFGLTCSLNNIFQSNTGLKVNDQNEFDYVVGPSLIKLIADYRLTF